MDGGYYPLSYDNRLSVGVKDAVSSSMQDLMKDGRFGATQTRRGHTKARAQHFKGKVRLDLNPLFMHINQVVTDLTMSEAIESGYRILHHPKVTAAIGDVAGSNVFQQLDMWLKDLAVGGVVGEATFDNMLDGLRAGVSISVMGFKLSTILVQPTGYLQSVVRLGPSYAARGLVRFLGGGRLDSANNNAAFAMERSKILKHRTTTFHRDIYHAMQIMARKGKIRGNIAKAGFWPIVKMQLAVDVPTWLGAYEKGLAQFGTEEQAVEFADMVLVQTQSSGLMKDLSGFERGTTGAQTRMSPMVRLWTVFYSYFNAKLNLAYESTRRTDWKKPADVARLASDYVILFWLEAVATAVLQAKLPDFDDDEEDPMLWNLKLVVSNVAATLPGLREIAGGVQGFDAAPAGLRGLEEIAGAAKATGKAVGDVVEGEEIDINRVIASLNSAAGIVFKYPAAQINQMLRAMSDAEKGEEVAPIDYVLYRKTGS